MDEKEFLVLGAHCISCRAVVAPEVAGIRSNLRGKESNKTSLKPQTNIEQENDPIRKRVKDVIYEQFNHDCDK
mgnify:CR=1 FL=1